MPGYRVRKVFPFVLGVTLSLAACRPPPTGKITIDSRPQGATVDLDGKECPSPCDFDLPPGEYEVYASMLNYKHAHDFVTVTAHGKSFKTLHLLPMVPTEDEAERMHLRKKPVKPGDAY
jgi:hypothetical protein